MMRADPVTGEKTCNQCKHVKRIDDFPKNKARPDGLHTECLGCNAANQRARRSSPEGEEAARNANRIWRDANREHVMFNSCQARAKSKNLPCTITKEDILIPDNCPVCGQALIPNRSGTRGPIASTPSVDMYNPALGYIPSNIWVICWRCNVRKQDMSGEDHIAFGIKLIEAFKGGKERIDIGRSLLSRERALLSLSGIGET